jgi:Tol biopolymer transport system component
MRLSLLLSVSSVSLVLSGCKAAEIIELGGDAGHPGDAATSVGAPSGLNTPPLDASGDVGEDVLNIGIPVPFADAASSNSIALPATGGPASAADGWILFDSDTVNLVPHIFAIRADGSGLTQLTSGASPDTDPAVSADGKTVLFSSTRTGAPQIFSLDVASQAIAQLTSIGAGADEPTFSPDGKTIAFHAANGVYVMNADGSSQHEVIVPLDQSFGEDYEHPVFAADGNSIIVDRLNEVDAFDLSGKMLRYVVGNTTADEQFPALSRDGANIAFVADACNPVITSSGFAASDVVIRPFLRTSAA